MIKAIDTRYNNHLFRSRLEARYAVFFDELKVKWLYEYEGFELGNNDRYLPDFYLPDYGIYAEIKPIAFNYKEHSKCKRLANLTQRKVIELVGLPNNNLTTIIIPSQYSVCSKCGHKESYGFDGNRIYCECKAKHLIFNRINEEQGYVILHSGKHILYECEHNSYSESEKTINAIKKSTEARFEFKK